MNKSPFMRRRESALQESKARAKIDEEKTHEELLALHALTSEDIANLKKDNRTYLVYYSAIAAAIISQTELHNDNILILFAIGACICRILIWDNRRHLKNRREIIIRVIGKFSETFKHCNAAAWQYRNPKYRGFVDHLIYHVQLVYPIIMLAVTWIVLYPTESSHPQVLWLFIAIMGCIVWDFIFLNSIWRDFFLVVIQEKLLMILGLLGTLVPILGLVYEKTLFV